jgi:hypothetical protein
VAKIDSNLFELPEDSASLRVLVQQLLLEREEQKRHVDGQQRRADEQSQQKEQLNWFA